MRARRGILVKIWADTCYFVSEIQFLNFVLRILASSGLIFTFDYLQKGINLVGIVVIFEWIITLSRENFCSLKSC